MNHYRREEMFFNSKPLLYLQILNRSILYLAVNPSDKKIIDQDEIIFEKDILEDGEFVNRSLLETRLDALIKEKKWKNVKTQVLLANNFIVLREETVPAQLTESEIRDYLDLHIGETIRIPYADPIFDFEIISEDEEEKKIFILAYPGDKVKVYQKMLKKLSLKPVVADIIPLSLHRLMVKNRMIDEKKHTLLLEWNPYDTSFMVFHQDRPTFYRQSESINLSESWGQNMRGDWFWKHSEEELERSIEEQMNGLERFLDFYSYSVLDGAGSVTDIVLTGYYPNLLDLSKRLSAQFSIDIRILDMPAMIEPKFGPLYGLTLKKEKKKRSSKNKKGADLDD